LIEVIQEQPFNGYESDGHNDNVIRVADQLKQPLEKALIGIIPTDKMTGNIDQDGVHADDFEKEGPLFIAQDVDYVVKKGHQQQA
jgi:hypothetical protein